MCCVCGTNSPFVACNMCGLVAKRGSFRTWLGHLATKSSTKPPLNIPSPLFGYLPFSVRYLLPPFEGVSKHLPPSSQHSFRYPQSRTQYTAVRLIFSKCVSVYLPFGGVSKHLHLSTQHSSLNPQSRTQYTAVRKGVENYTPRLCTEMGYPTKDPPILGTSVLLPLQIGVYGYFKGVSLVHAGKRATDYVLNACGLLRQGLIQRCVPPFWRGGQTLASEFPSLFLLPPIPYSVHGRSQPTLAVY